MSKQLVLAFSAPSTSSAVGSHVKTSPARAIARALLDTAADCGASSIAWSWRCIRLGLSSKTSRPALRCGSTESSVTWKAPAMNRYRSRCRHRIAALRTSGAVCLWSDNLLPTACARDWKGTGYEGQLGTMSARGLLPTPSATSYGTSGNGCPGDGRAEYAHKGTPSLHTMARRGLLPTPTRGDAAASGSRNTEASKAHPGVSLTDWARGDAGGGAGWNRNDAPEPTVRRVDDGLASRMDRLRLAALGNAVVPQCAEVVGNVIRELIELHVQP